MNKYFIQLFLKENTVILPGFGALTAPNGNIEDIMFLPYLQTDDGKLAEFISETEGIDKQDAQNTIAKFIREMETNLSKGESFDIFKFGSFYKNEDGDVEFKSWMKQKREEEKLKEEAKAIEEETEKKEDISRIAALANEISVEPIVFDDVNISESTSSTQEKIKQETKTTAPPLVEATTSVEEKKSIPPIVEPVKQKIDKKKNSEKEKPKKKKFGFMFWLLNLMTLTLIVAGIYYFTRDNNNSNLLDTTNTAQNSDNENTESSSEIEEKDTKIETSTTAEEKPPEVKEEEKAIPPMSGSTILFENASGFYIIGGVYPTESSTQKKIQKLKSEGINALSLKDGEKKFYISLANFTDKNEAKNSLKAFRDKGFKVWLLKK